MREKGKGSTTMSVRMPVTMYQEVCAIAKFTDRTKSGVVRLAIKSALPDLKRKTIERNDSLET